MQALSIQVSTTTADTIDAWAQVFENCSTRSLQAEEHCKAMSVGIQGRYHPANHLSIGSIATRFYKCIVPRSFGLGLLADAWRQYTAILDRKIPQELRWWDLSLNSHSLSTVTCSSVISYFQNLTLNMSRLTLPNSNGRLSITLWVEKITCCWSDSASLSHDARALMWGVNTTS